MPDTHITTMGSKDFCILCDCLLMHLCTPAWAFSANLDYCTSVHNLLFNTQGGEMVKDHCTISLMVL